MTSRHALRVLYSNTILETEFHDRVGGNPGLYSQFAGYFNLETENIK
jgi:hypothetical protein